MSKWRKKPIVIEAVQFVWNTWTEMRQHIGAGLLEDGKPEAKMDDTKWQLFIPTLEGLMTADEGDWIIKGVQGELYPVKPDIFAATYEEVTDADTEAGG